MTDQTTVPGKEATWPEIWHFALSYNAYDRHGGFDGAAKIGNTCAERWAKHRWLPNDLDLARAALFFEQRRHHHLGEDPAGEDAQYVRSLLRRISELSGGTVEGPPGPAVAM